MYFVDTPYTLHSTLCFYAILIASMFTWCRLLLLDLANPKTNHKSAGFTPEEREEFTKLLDEGFIDSYRSLYPDQENAYSYWTYMMNCRAKNIGWWVLPAIHVHALAWVFMLLLSITFGAVIVWLKNSRAIQLKECFTVSGDSTIL